MRIINYNPSIVAEDIARLEKTINDYNSSVTKRTRVLDKISVILTVFAFLMFVAMIVAAALIEPFDVVVLTTGVFAALAIICICVVIGMVPNLVKPHKDIGCEYTKVMRYHLATQGKKVLSTQLKSFDLYEPPVIVFKIKENDNTVSTLTLELDKTVEKMEIQEAEIDIENKVLYIPYEKTR